MIRMLIAAAVVGHDPGSFGGFLIAIAIGSAAAVALVGLVSLPRRVGGRHRR